MTDTPAVRHRITTLEWVGIGAGVLALVASFLPWYRLSGSITQDPQALGQRTWLSAWGTYFLGWFPIVLLAAVAVLIIGQRVARPIPMVASLWLTLALVSVLMILLRWITIPDASSITGRGEDYAAFHGGIGLYLGLAAAIVSLVTGFLAFRAAQKGKPSAATA